MFPQESRQRPAFFPTHPKSDRDLYGEGSVLSKHPGKLELVEEAIDSVEELQ